MTKPLGFYTNYTPGDTGLLEEMQSCWGATFHELNNVDRLWMISKLADELCAELDEDDQVLSDGVEEAVERSSSELSVSDRLGLMLALVNQARTMP